MFVKEIASQSEWDNFVFSQPFYTFMNSWHWGQFNRLMGSKIYRLGFYRTNPNLRIGYPNAPNSRITYPNYDRYSDKYSDFSDHSDTFVDSDYTSDKLLGIALIIKIEAKRGTHLFCPYGPLINCLYKDEEYFEILGQIIAEIRNIAVQEKASFVRINPIVENNAGNIGKLKKMNLKFAPLHVHAEDTWLLDIAKPESQLLTDMRKTTRYLIKRAEKETVKIEKNNSQEYIRKFIAMHRQHALRSRGNNYTPFSENYIFNLFKAFPEPDINLLYAEYNNFIEAILVSIKYGKTMAYYLGVSDIKNPKFSPAYLLQWTAIKKAQQEGCTLYNFWGVSPDENPKHPLAGVTLFKKGFGGHEYKLIHVHDLAVSHKYWANYAVESLRRWKRGYYYIS